MLGWFADGADPDGGLLAFRRLSDELGTTHWYLKLLRDSGTAARRLARVLSTSRYVADALTRSPESVTWLADDADLVPRTLERLTAEADAILTRSDEPVPAVTALRGLRRRELARTAAADVLGVVTGRARVAEPERRGRRRPGRARCASPSGRRARTRGSTTSPTRLLVVAMGRLGRRGDGLLLRRRRAVRARPRRGCGPAGGAGVRAPGDDEAAHAARDRRAGADRSRSTPTCARRAATVRWSGRSTPTPSTTSAGPSPWESQALLRARPVAGDDELGERFLRLIDPLRYPAGGVDAGGRARGAPHQGARRGRAAAARRRAGPAPQARARRASPTSSGPPSCSSSSTRTRCRRCAPRRRSRRSRRRPRRASSTPTTRAC